MVKHKRCSHQHDIHSLKIDNMDAFESNSKSYPIPQQSRHLHWSMNTAMRLQPSWAASHKLHLAYPFANFGQQIEQFPVIQTFDHGHHFSDGDPIINLRVPENKSLMTRPERPSAIYSYHIPEYNNSRLTTSSTNSLLPQIHHSTLRQHSQEIPHSNPARFSPVYRADPIHGELYCDHLTAKATAYNFRNSPSAEQQSAVQLQQMSHHLTGPQYKSASLQNCQWHDTVPFQSFIEVASQMHFDPVQTSPDSYLYRAEIFDHASSQMQASVLGACNRHLETS